MSEPLRVMHLITSLTVGGAETMLLKLDAEQKKELDAGRKEVEELTEG